MSDLERRHGDPAGTGDTNQEDSGHGSLVVPDDRDRFPVPDPGLEEHLPRLTDVDEQAADRQARLVSTFFLFVPILSVLFVVIYFAVPRQATVGFGPFFFNAQTAGFALTGGLALLFVGVGAVQWARQLMSDHEMVDERHGAESSADERAEVIATLEEGIQESGVPRRRVLIYSLLGAGALALPIITLFADLGPWPTKRVRAATIETTIWAPNIRLVNDVTYEPIKAEDMQIGQLVNAQPENLKDLHGTEFLQAKAKCSIIIVRMYPNTIKIPESRQSWQVGGILAYSKICTHVGCPISLWEQQTHHLLCPCHQSTFDLGDSGVVVFGPAARSLPQLPIKVDEQGYLLSQSGFTVPVGPSFFERDSSNDYRKGEN